MTAEKKFWAKRNTRQVGPCATEEEALALFRATYPLTADQRRKRERGGTWIGRIFVEHGENGPDFGTWHDAEGK